MIHALRHYLQIRRLKRELAEFARQFEANLPYVAGYVRRRTVG